MSSSRNFFPLRYAPDCTFSSRKMKKLPTVGGGHPPPTLPPLRRYAPSQRLRPQMFWLITPLTLVTTHTFPLGAPPPPPPMRWPTVRHWPCVMFRWTNKQQGIHHYQDIYDWISINTSWIKFYSVNHQTFCLILYTQQSMGKLSMGWGGGGKSSHLSVFTSLKHNDVFKVQIFSGLHVYTFKVSLPKMNSSKLVSFAKMNSS